MRPARTTKTTRAIQQAMTGLIITSVFAPLAALSPKKVRPRKRTVQKVGHSLGSVIQQLRAAKSLLPGRTPRPDRIEPSPRIPTGARYLSRRHRGAAGSRGYKIYLPASQPDRPKGLILMLHGCNQTPDDFARGSDMNALAEKHGLAIAYPEQTHGHNAGLCWNWFKPGHQVRDAGEPAILASLTRKLMKELGLGRDAVFVAGLSAGGAMAAILADVYPDLFSAAGVHSGLARGAARDVVTAASAMRSGGPAESPPPAVAPESLPVRRIVFHGDADTTVHPSNATMIGAAAMGGLAQPTRRSERSVRGRGYVRSDFAGSGGVIMLEVWMLLGAGHAWSGGRSAGSYTDSKGPDASAQMIRFFLNKRT
jgi:poly(hydroxyalkanoate) depolymerase family esterase